MKEKKYSKFGISSFIISILAAASSFVATNWFSEQIFFILSFMIASLLLAAIAVVFGIAGLKQKDRRISFPILGTAISILILVFWGVILIF